MYRFVLLCLLTPALTCAATIPVAPGQSIQQALNRAQTGDTVQLAPGTYTERLTIPRDALTLQGIPGQTILDSSTPAASWQPAPQMGAGVWQAQLGYVPYNLSAGGRTVWRISDRAMRGETLFGTSGPGIRYLGKPGGGSVPYWDGVEALYGVQGATTYLRFRGGEHPAQRSVRAGPQGATVTVNGVQRTTIRGLTIRGGQMQVAVTGGARQTIIEDCTLTQGYVRVLVREAHGTVIRRNRIRMDGIMTTRVLPGDWNETSAARQVMHRMYAENKFLVGETRENDNGIQVAHSTDTLIEGNDIQEGIVGIELRDGAGTRILGNTIAHHAAQGIWPYETTGAEIGHNLFYDNDHHIRIQLNPQGNWDKKLHIYANRFWQPMPGDSAKHIHLSFVGCPNCTSGSDLWIYHNSFAGGGWAVDVGGTGEGTKNIPGLRLLNNVVSTRGWSSGGFHQRGEVSDNLEQPVWRTTTLPDFLLPAALRDQATSLIPRGLPGMTAAYIGDGKPDHGARQAGTRTDEQPPTTAGPPAPRNLRVLAGQ